MFLLCLASKLILVAQYPSKISSILHEEMKLKEFKNHLIDGQRIQFFFKATEVWIFFINPCMSLTKFQWMKRIILLSNIYRSLCFPEEQKERISNDWSPTSPSSVAVFCAPHSPCHCMYYCILQIDFPKTLLMCRILHLDDLMAKRRGKMPVPVFMMQLFVL